MFFNYFRFFSNLGSLSSFEDTKEQENDIKHKMKQWLYLLFLLALPMPSLYSYLSLISLFAILFSITSRFGSQWTWTKLFLEEESMNLGLILMMPFSGQIIRCLLLGCLASWALLECCHWGAQVLLKDPNTIGIALLKIPIEIGILYRVEVVQFKNHIEVFVGLISVLLVFAGRCAPIFPVFYWQYLRVKYVVNQWEMPTGFQSLWSCFQKHFSPTVRELIKNKKTNLSKK